MPTIARAMPAAATPPLLLVSALLLAACAQQPASLPAADKTPVKALADAAASAGAADAEWAGRLSRSAGDCLVRPSPDGLELLIAARRNGRCDAFGADLAPGTSEVLPGTRARPGGASGFELLIARRPGADSTGEGAAQVAAAR